MTPGPTEVLVAACEAASGELPAGHRDAESFCRFAEHLASQAGGPSVRAVVLLDSRLGEAQPVILARYPRLVLRMSRPCALAHTAPKSWRRFLSVESVPAFRAFIHWRTPSGLHSEKLHVEKAAELTTVARLLGVDRCLFAADAPPAPIDVSFQETLAADVRAEITGATRFARSLLKKRGLRHADNRSTLTVQRQTTYSIFRPPLAVFDPADSTLSNLVAHRPVLLVSDLTVAAIYAPAWRRYSRQKLALAGELLLDLSEKSKAWNQVHDICGYALQCGLPRNGVIIAVGGGVTLDVVGFAASIFRRGVHYLRIPTSLVGLVDVAVGVKQGVNSHGKKNLLGSFYPPLASINDYRFLKSLPAGEISCGMAEILKMALLRDPVMFEQLEQFGVDLVDSRFSRPPVLAEELLRRAELLMLEELAPNLFERTFARLVDFGHTFSPVIETATQHQIPHGRAVALDILISAALAVTLGHADTCLLKRLIALLPNLGLPVWDELVPSSDVLFDALPGIASHRGGSLNLILVAEPGRSLILHSLSRSDLNSALRLLKQSIPAPAGGAFLQNRAYARTAV